MVHRHLKAPVNTLAPVGKLAEKVQKTIVKTALADAEDAYSSAGHSDYAHSHVSTSAHDAGDGGSIAHRTTSRSSFDSSRSKASSSRRRPQFAPAAPRRGGNEGEEDEDEDFDDHGFDHPSTYAEQPWIWVPRDQLGLSQYFVEEFRAVGVHAGDDGATMDERGEVEVNRSPPDEDWNGGHDA